MTVEPAEEPINADATYEPLIEAERQAADDAAHDDKGRGVLRFYELAKKQEWQVRDMAVGRDPADPGDARRRLAGAEGAAPGGLALGDHAAAPGRRARGR